MAESVELKACLSRLERFAGGEHVRTIYKLPPTGRYDPLRDDIKAVLAMISASPAPEGGEGASGAESAADVGPCPSAPPAQHSAGSVTIPREPPEELLMSMAIRHDHALSVPGYYDQEFFGAERVPHEARLRAALNDMRKIYEVVVGEGFYRPERADFYRALLPTSTTQEAGHE